jgi:hypothetical protein
LTEAGVIVSLRRGIGPLEAQALHSGIDVLPAAGVEIAAAAAQRLAMLRDARTGAEPTPSPAALSPELP